MTRSQTPPKQMAKKLVRLLRVERPDYQYLKKVFQHTRSMLTISPAKVQSESALLITDVDHDIIAPIGTSRYQSARARAVGI